jgi:phage tail sheath protein FI
MPEYLAPGVYVEEVSYRTRSIEGVSTTTTAFVGPTRYGPLHDPLDIITNLNEFELTYGDREKLAFGGGVVVDNWMWHAARAFFEEGGRRLYVKRIYNDGPANVDGRATKVLLAGTPGQITVTARHPGAAGNLHVTFTVQAGQNVLTSSGGASVVRGLSDHDLVLVTTTDGSPATTRPATAISYLDTATGARGWRFDPGGSPPGGIDLGTLDPAAGEMVQPVTVTVSVASTEPGAIPRVRAALPLDPAHQLGGAPDSMAAIFDDTSDEARGTPVVIDVGTNHDGRDVLAALDAASGGKLVSALIADAAVEQRSVDVVLAGGSDGSRPTSAEYEGEILGDDTKTGLVAFEDIDDISIVAAPGCTHNYANREDDAQACVNALITHARRMRYRIAVVDSGDKQTIADVRAMRAKFDSNYAAFYYPWIRILDPVTGLVNFIPPSGVVAGIYARNDVDRAVYKAPANEVVNVSIGFERLLSKSQQEVLNPEGINCFRYFYGRGYRLWGARMMSSDSEWKYVNLRRYFAFLEHSIDRGTQWAVFEPNGERLWASVRGTIDDFLLDQWQSGALLGDKPEKAYFVRCDRSTMTQNDLDNGRLVCQIGVAPLRPAEFVIFRIGQWTADRKL